MPEPATTATATLVVTGAAVPVLTILGISLGLRVDVLLGGLLGAIAALAFLNTVPSSGDTWRELVRTSVKRVFVALASAGAAGYLAPLLSMINGVPEPLILSVAFVAGAGAPQLVPWVVDWLKGRGPGPRPPGGPST